MEAVQELELGRDAFAARDWGRAHAALAQADAAGRLAAGDLERLATAAYLVGRDDEFVEHLERAHHAHLDAGDAPRAVRCAFWIAIVLSLLGRDALASGWLGRAHRLLEREERDCVERGYLLMPVVLRSAAAGDDEAAYAAAAEAADIGERFGDRDLVALAVHEQGHARVRQGRVEEGLALLDEAMVSVTAGELSPIVTGLVYCSVIAGCQQVYALARSQEWTAALTRWCEEQPDLVPFTGPCLVHRAEIMELHGAWGEALDEARRAAEHLARRPSQPAAAEAHYRQGEVHRLRGEYEAAEAAYREASRGGCEPQPGLALLRLAQGDPGAAAAAIRRVLAETSEPLERARMLPACVEIALADGDPAAAREACRELDGLAERYGSPMLRAMADQAAGAVALAGDDAQGALVLLRRAWRAWEGLEAPYEAARVRVLLAGGCRALGDEDAAALELEAAVETFDRLGARPDLRRAGELAGIRSTGQELTPRELEVLRLVAAGETNKAIAARLVLSERTVDRHVSNILAKLRVPSRAAATAYAYEHGLL